MHDKKFAVMIGSVKMAVVFVQATESPGAVSK